MFQCPVTFLFDFEHTSEKMRPYIMHEFAANGAKHLVLSDVLISMILEKDYLADTLLRELQAEGLSFVDAHAPFGTMLDLNCPDPALRKRMITRLILALRITADMGVDTITVHVGNNNHPGAVALSVNENIALIKDGLEKILPTAEACGLTVGIENIWFPTNTPERLLELKEAFPTPNLGFCYDAGHANLMDQGRIYPDGAAKKAWEYAGFSDACWENRTLEKMLPHVVNCHLHDNDGKSDQHRNIGNGNINWPHIIGLLKKAPHLKNIQSEVIPVREKESIRKICEQFERLGNM